MLPDELVREEGTSFHYAPPTVSLRTSEALNERMRSIANALGIELVQGKHWTMDAIHRSTFGKVAKYGEQGVCSVDMELSALAGVAHYRRCQLAALLLVTDVVTRSHTWNGTASAGFHEGVTRICQIAVRIFPGPELE